MKAMETIKLNTVPIVRRGKEVDRGIEIRSYHKRSELRTSPAWIFDTENGDFVTSFSRSTEGIVYWSISAISPGRKYLFRDSGSESPYVKLEIVKKESHYVELIAYESTADEFKNELKRKRIKWELLDEKQKELLNDLQGYFQQNGRGVIFRTPFVPSADVRAALRKLGFQWSKQGFWYY